MPKYFKVPFASSGQVQVVPNDTQLDNSVSYTQGYTPAYSIDFELDPVNARLVERQTINALYKAVTENLKVWQEGVFPEFITATDNGGTAYSYPSGSIVTYQGVRKISLQDENTDTPDLASWVDLFPLPEQFGGTGLTSLNDLVAGLNLGTASAVDVGTGLSDVPSVQIANDLYLKALSNLSDLNDVQVARGNLGLGSIATEDSSVFTNGLLPLVDADAWRTAIGAAASGAQQISSGDIINSADITIVDRGYLAASGQLVGRDIYPDLFSVIGERFGAGNGTTTFRLPDNNEGVIPPVSIPSWGLIPLTGYGDEINFTYSGVETDKANGDIYAINTGDTDDTIYKLAFGDVTWAAVTRNGLPVGDMGLGLGVSQTTKDVVVTIGEDPYILEFGSGIWTALPVSGLPVSRGTGSRIFYDDTNNRIYIKFLLLDEVYWLPDTGVGSWTLITIAGMPLAGVPVDYSVNSAGDLYSVTDVEPIVSYLPFGGVSWVQLSDIDLPDTGAGRLSVGYNSKTVFLAVESNVYHLVDGESIWKKATTSGKLNSTNEINFNEFSETILSTGSAIQDPLESLVFNQDLNKTFNYIRA